MKTIFEIIGIGFLLIVTVIVVLIIVIPYQIITDPFYQYKKKKAEEKYLEFIKAQEGEIFFVYKKTRTVKFIKKHILPILPEEVKVILLKESSNIENNTPFYLRMFGDIKQSSNFPCFVKIINSKIIRVSVHKELFIWKNLERDKTPLFEKVQEFIKL